MNRQIIITNTITNEQFAMQFDIQKTKDSEALHHMLCFIDPGEEYTVQFTNEPTGIIPSALFVDSI